MVPIELLGRALAILREKQHKTQEEVATAAGITASMISNYERGKEKPSLDSLWKILGAMSCTLIDLEASLRFARGDVFPMHCENWRIIIDNDEYEIGSRSRLASEVVEPDLDLSGVFQGETALSAESERYMTVQVKLLLRLLRMIDQRSA